jgi:hypothetical protein
MLKLSMNVAQQGTSADVADFAYASLVTSTESER